MSRFWGYLSAIMVAILFGVWYSLDKILLGYLHPLVLAAMVYTLASMLLLLIRISPLNSPLLEVMHCQSKVETHITGKNYVTLFLTAICGAVMAPALYLSGLDQITQ